MDVTPFTVGDWAVDRLLDALRPHAARFRFRLQHHPSAVEASLSVVSERPGQQVGAGQHLETVTDPDQRSAEGNELGECVAKSGDQIECQHATCTEGISG